jgi:hypothetical protein
VSVYEYRPKVPSRDQLRESMRTGSLRVVFDPTADELLVFWRECERPAVSIFLTEPDWLALLVDPDTHEVIGFHIEAFRQRAVREVPELSAVLTHAACDGESAAQGTAETLAALLGRSATAA